jgi:hypothetical protein
MFCLNVVFDVIVRHSAKVPNKRREERKEKTLTVSRQNNLIVRKTREISSDTVLGFCKNGSCSRGIDVHGLSFNEERL